MNTALRRKFFRPVYVTASNSLSALDAQLWANEALMIIERELTLPSQVNIDYQDELAEPGDVINLYIPNDLSANRKPEHSAITYEAVSAADDTLRLNNNIYSAFELTQRQIKRSFADLAGTFLPRSARAVIEQIDATLMGEFYGCHKTGAGKFGTAVDYAALVKLATAIDNNNIGRSDPRFLNVTPDVHGMLLGEDKFVQAHIVGNEESRVLSGLVGSAAGFNVFMSGSSQTVAAGSDTTAGAVDNGSGYAAGATTLVVDGFTGRLENGCWCTIVGDMTPQLIVANAATVSDTDEITIYPGLRNSVLDNAVITVYDHFKIDHAAGYPALHEGALTVDSVTATPAIGQGVTIGGTAAGTTLDPADVDYYSVVKKTAATSITLNKPPKTALADDTKLYPMPPGSYCPGFTSRCVTMANRPIAIPDSGVVSAAIASDPQLGLSIRVMISYDRDVFKYKYSIDTLIGTKLLYPQHGSLLFA